MAQPLGPQDTGCTLERIRERWQVNDMASLDRGGLFTEDPYATSCSLMLLCIEEFGLMRLCLASLEHTVAFELHQNKVSLYINHSWGNYNY